MHRRNFLKSLAVVGVSNLPLACSYHTVRQGYESFPLKGQVRLMHITDSHAQLKPNYYREASLNLGFNSMYNKPPHLVGKAILEYYNLTGKKNRYAFSHLDFEELAHQYGKTGGYAHIKTLVDRLRNEAGSHKSLLLDGGDTWQGSGISLWYRGQDMVAASNLLGVDAATGHWEFTYEEEEIYQNIKQFNGQFLAQNVYLTEEAQFDEQPAFDEDSGQVFKPYEIYHKGDAKIAVIGQAFPYTSIANPRRFIPHWSFGIRASELQETINEIKGKKVDVIVLLSHNGMDVDLKLASVVQGIDIIMGGHSHDVTPQPIRIKNSYGSTLIVSGSSHGKCLGVFDLTVKNGRLNDVQYQLIPVFSEQLPADKEMQTLIDKYYQPYAEKLREPLAYTEGLLYRRGNFNGTFDQLICEALNQENNAQISLSPGFRWGTSILSNSQITMEDLLAQTAMTYPETYRNNIKGEQLKLILEDVADNLYNPDPFYQQGGDMVRTAGLTYTIDPTAKIGSRINNLRLTNGKLIDANKTYPVAGWSTVGNQSQGEPIWQQTARYLKNLETLPPITPNIPKIIGIQNNKGL